MSIKPFKTVLLELAQEHAETARRIEAEACPVSAPEKFPEAREHQEMSEALRKTAEMWR